MDVPFSCLFLPCPISSAVQRDSFPEVQRRLGFKDGVPSRFTHFTRHPCETRSEVPVPTFAPTDFALREAVHTAGTSPTAHECVPPVVTAVANFAGEPPG